MRIIKNVFVLFFSFVLVTSASFLFLQKQNNKIIHKLSLNNNFSQHIVSVYSNQYLEVYHQYGLHLPPFYFSVSNLALPDSFKYLPATPEKDFLIKWSSQTGNPDCIYQIFQSMNTFHEENLILPPAKYLQIQSSMNQLLMADQIDSLNSYYSRYKFNLPSDSKTKSFLMSIEQIKVNHHLLQFVPVIHFNKLNQYSSWCSDFIFNSNGIYSRSWYSQSGILSELKRPLLLTMIISLGAFILITIVSFIGATELFLYKKSFIANVIIKSLTYLYSTPAFFIGAILIYFFSNPYCLQWLPSNFSFAPLFDHLTIFSIVESWNYFVLPLITFSFGATLFFLLFVFRLYEEEFTKNYVLSAKMMGLSNRKIAYRFVIKNILYSSSTFLFLLIPGLLSGSFVVENLFSIAGIGNLTMTAIRNQDLPLIVCLNGFIGLVTVVCYLILNVFQQRINGRTIKNKIVEG